jgi:ABC-type multidrug transport system fused ATPase/permease subunit
VSIDGVWLRYNAGLPWVLRGVQLELPHGTKCAVVGRTGAGKSSVLQALLRMYPYEQGAIRVGGTELQSLPAAASRALVTPLLQDGWLFSGTVRENLLGPLSPPPGGTRGSGGLLPRLLSPRSRTATGAASDREAALWAVLRAAGLADVVTRMPGGLDEPLTEHGANMSAGERALLCLARALLRQRLGAAAVAAGSAAVRVQTLASVPRPPPLPRLPDTGGLIVCDEPTAQVDVDADAVVHNTLLGLPDTLLCICHRLKYVPRFDLVAVVDGGRCVEVGRPADLLAAGPAASAFAALAASVQW